uniref:proteasome endopeptidase complex n=1 Tax=Suricata suricatta TaxID=37032 RepID=A0A673T8G1_SURSU
MAAVSVYESPVGGFSFDNCRRNAVLEADFAKKGYKLPTARKTGTTIAGVVYKDGIVLGADTRATEGMVVADKNCSKIHFISPNIYCCGAGTAADTDMTTQLISSNLELHSLSTGRLPRVVTANRMLKQMLFRYQGYIGAALVLGGVDVTGPHLYSIYPHGSTDKLPYVTMGSGSLAAMAVFEDKFRPDMEVCEACGFLRFHMFFQLRVGRLQIDCHVLQSVCGTAVRRNALWRREPRLLRTRVGWESFVSEWPCHALQQAWGASTLRSWHWPPRLLAVECFVCPKLSVPRGLRRTSLFAFSLRIEKLSLFARHTDLVGKWGQCRVPVDCSASGRSWGQDRVFSGPCSEGDGSSVANIFLRDSVLYFLWWGRVVPSEWHATRLP